MNFLNLNCGFLYEIVLFISTSPSLAVTGILNETCFISVTEKKLVGTQTLCTIKVGNIAQIIMFE